MEEGGEGYRDMGGREEGGEKTFGFLEDAVDGAGAAGAGHCYVEFVVVGLWGWGWGWGCCHCGWRVVGGEGWVWVEV